jgi:hypothetical protein
MVLKEDFMRLRRSLALIIAQLGSLFSAAHAFGSIADFRLSESASGKIAGQSESEQFDEVVISVNSGQIDLERLEKFINEMHLKYEVISFDGESLELKMPHRDKLILAMQLETAN